MTADEPGLRRSRRRRRRSSKPEAAPELEAPPPNDELLPVVSYTPVRCPKCGKRDRETYGQYYATRYHRCHDCGIQFRSRETPWQAV